MKCRIAITLGDPAGIGPDVVSEALKNVRVRNACHPIVVGDPMALALHHRPLPRFEMLSTPGLNRKLSVGKPSKEAGLAAIRALNAGLGLIKTRQAHALVTAPVSKESFHLADHGFPGHTEWLAKASGAREVAMLMVSGPLRVILMTRHVPLADVCRHLTPSVVRSSIRLGYAFVRDLLKRSRPKLVICGVNPHAGDQGLIGREEIELLRPVLRASSKEGMPVAGPFSADVVFPNMAKGAYDLALAAYHDQGMIPLKLYDSSRMVNVTLGLPFIRTSPAHGTAFDIAGKKRANPAPMIEAILQAAAYAQACDNA